MAWILSFVDNAVLRTLKRKRGREGEWSPTPSHFRQAGSQNLDEQSAERIVNKYGEALLRAGELNMLKVHSLMKELASGRKDPRDVAQELGQRHGESYDLLSMKADTSLLPYPKETIREAIELLLKKDTDPENIRLLKEGLRYLDSFA